MSQDVASKPPKGWLSGDRAVWQRRYVQLTLGLDAVVLIIVTLPAVLFRFGNMPTPNGIPYPLVATIVTLLWLLGLALGRCYEADFVLKQSHELARVAKATGEVFAAIALLSFLTDAQVSRLYLVWVFPIGLLGLMANRVLAHLLLRRARGRGLAQRRVLLVGDQESVVRLATAFQREPMQGHQVVALATSGTTAGELMLGDGRHVPVIGNLDFLADRVREVNADTVAVAPGASLDAETFQFICYALEGLGIDLLVAPSLANVAGSRISVRPVAGLPLLQLDEPQLDGPHRFLKGVFDRASAFFGLLLLAPALLLIALAIKLNSRGPVFFKHERVGRDGQPFLVWKFRSMDPNAAAQQDELMAAADHDGPLFKLKNDPRVTSVGRFLRKWSLDELPQLINVLKGDMSLVGPRPQVRAEVALYEGYAHRRLLVKPGITGLWQVSGRSDLEWEQALRLDLTYVDEWSLGFDLAILGRTVAAVVQASGAY